MIRALRVAGWVLAVLAAASAMTGGFFVVGLTSEGGSAGIAMLLLSGVVTWLWQSVAGAAMALLCFAAARVLERTGG